MLGSLHGEMVLGLKDKVLYMVLYGTFLKKCYIASKGFCYCRKLDIITTEEPFFGGIMYNTFSINLKNHLSMQIVIYRTHGSKENQSLH